MKIVINETGKIEEVSARVASRLINKGKAHYPEKQKVVTEIKEKVVKVEPVFNGIEEIAIKPKVEIIKKPKRRYRKKKSKFRSYGD